MNTEKINLETELQQQLEQAQELNAKLEELLTKVSMGILQGSDKTGQIINAAEAVRFLEGIDHES